MRLDRVMLIGVCSLDFVPYFVRTGVDLRTQSWFELLIVGDHAAVMGTNTRQSVRGNNGVILG